MSAKLTLTPSESVEIRSSTATALEVEVTYGSGGSPPPKHFHPLASSGIAGDDHAEVGIGIAEAHVRVAFLIERVGES